MLEHFLTSGVLISGIFFIRFLLGSHIQQRLRYALWLLVLAKLLLPMLSFESVQNQSFASIAKTVQGQLSESFAGSQIKAGQEVQSGPGTGTDKGIRSANSSAIGQQDSLAAAVLRTVYDPGTRRLCCLIWVLVSALMAICLSAANIRFLRQLHNSRKAVSDGLGPLCIYESDAVSSPCLAGVIHPAIYPPEGFEKEEVCVEHIIAHEYMHYRHKDHIWALLRCICVCVYWFRPLVWAAAFASVRDGELACDEAAIQYLGEQERQRYGRTLIQAAAYGDRMHVPLSYAGSKNREMKERISMIVKKPKTAVSACIILLIAVLLLAGVAFRHTDTREKGDQVQTAAQIQNSDTDKGTEESVWEFQMKTKEDGYFINITDCHKEGSMYVLEGASYADAAAVFTNEEKKSLDLGEHVVISCDGAEQDYILSKNTRRDTEGSYLLSGGPALAGLELEKGQYGNQKGWILTDPYSGMVWQPLLKENEVLSVAAGTSVEVNNYYAYYEMFQSLFPDDVPDQSMENKDGHQWSMQEYFQYYLKNMKEMRKQKELAGDMLAKVRVTGGGNSVQLTDFYLP